MDVFGSIGIGNTFLTETMSKILQRRVDLLGDFYEFVRKFTKY